MLILTRRNNEAIKIGDDVTITVLAIRGSQVRLGIQAPKEISVHREEIYQRILAEKNAEDSETDDNETADDEEPRSQDNKIRFIG